MAKRRSSPTDTPLAHIRELAHLLREYGLSSVSASWAGVRIRLQREGASAAARPSAAADVPPVAETPITTGSPAPTSTTLVTVEAPMVGTFYRAPSPGSEPYVREGDTIKQGQTLCIIEAMKLMNEIESRLDGRLVKIVADNGQPVEYGQPLFLLEPLR
jgi:acetyl-CoA carboxylase biotin carboxyl carrier protein